MLVVASVPRLRRVPAAAALAEETSEVPKADIPNTVCPALVVAAVIIAEPNVVAPINVLAEAAVEVVAKVPSPRREFTEVAVPAETICPPKVEKPSTPL